MAQRRGSALLSLLVLPLALAATAPTTQDTQPRRGTFQTTFSEHSPLTATKKDLAKRFTPAPTYDLAAAKFTVHVPPSYDTINEPFGVLVLLNHESESKPPAPWLPVLDKNRLIFVTFADYFDAPLQGQASIAADVVHNLRQAYRMDERRTYVVGDFEAEAAAFYYPEVFTAGIFFGDYGHCRDVFDHGQHAYDPKLPAPQGVAAGRTKGRYYALCDVDDGRNGTHTLGHYMADAFRRDLTPNVELIPINQTDTTYSTMTTHWLERALATFDAHLPAPAKQPAARVPAHLTVPAANLPAAPTTRPSAAPAVASEPQRHLALARTYIANRAYGPARTRLNAILTQHPADPAAKEAAALLDQIKDK